MNSLVFIRHAETDMAGKFCGHSDPPINQQGKLQIKKLLEDLHDRTFDMICSSDLRRALETAQEIAEACSLRIVESAALREIYFGDWEGLSWREIEQRDSAYSARWTDKFPTLPTPGGESYTAFRDRVLSEVDRLLLLSEAGSIAVVTHAGVMRVVLQERMGYSQQDAWDQAKAYCYFFECLLDVGIPQVVRG